jgi:hypothetical protein
MLQYYEREGMQSLIDWSFYALPSLSHYARDAVTVGTAGRTVPCNRKYEGQRPFQYFENILKNNSSLQQFYFLKQQEIIRNRKKGLRSLGDQRLIFSYLKFVP